MRRLLAPLLDRTSTIYIAASMSLVIGLFFTFVWAPHPWGWQGIDQYHDLASALARGEPFATTDVPWGYAYFAAAFYWLFGNRIWVPVTAQVLINAAAPILVYHVVRPMTSQRVAVLSAVITGAFSFNNLYASTQASDALCTILFLAALLTLSRAMATGRVTLFAVSGLLSGLVPQFRPNLVLLPALVVAGYVLYHRTARHARDMLVYGTLVVVALTPWIIRNYQLTGLFLPTSTHGGVQLWYGTLQVGPYLESRAHNPRSIFESAPFKYTSLVDTPLLIDVATNICTPPASEPTLVYWTDRDRRQISLAAESTAGRLRRYLLPGQPSPTAVYYYFQATRQSTGDAQSLLAPPGGPLDPYVWLVDEAHLRNLDRHDDFLDVFDVIALSRHLAWREPVTGPHLDLNGDGAISQLDLDRAVTLLLPEVPAPILAGLDVDGDRVRLELRDQSTIMIPKAWSGLHTDLEIQGNLAGHAISRSRTFSSLRFAGSGGGCELVDEVRVNDQFYRREPHLMRRYMALAVDNIRRDPWVFAAASAYRAVRLFIIRGSADRATAQQFSASRVAYAAGTALSATYFLVFLAGAWLAWRRRSALLWLLVPIIYVPLTICFVLTNMRYTVTVQPLMFVFVALAVVTALRLEPPINTD